jgi:CRISPR-associated exonuclease Cas4
MTLLGDESERLRVLTELQSTLLVEAAAGTGKTSLLAGRAVMLLGAGIMPRSIAAITFTELAAGELRQRVAHYLDALLARCVPDELRICLQKEPTPEQQARLRAAASQLDELTCSTIHGFCHDLLRTYSVEAGIDPGAEILDRDQANFVFDAIFDQWWRDRLNERRSNDDPVALIARKDPTGAEELLREFAKFRRRYRRARPLPSDLDASADRDFVKSVHEFRRWYNRLKIPTDADSEISTLETLAAHFGGHFEPPPNFDQLWDLAHPAWLPIMRKDSFNLRDYRRRTLWRRLGGKEHGERLADQAEEHYERCRESYSTLMGRIAIAIISVFSAELDGLISEYEAFKLRAAVLDFDDLLFTCRDVLHAYPLVRKAAAERYSRILVDEFQDTDPVQAEIIFLLTTEEESEIWHKRRLKSGHLFLVGDPKQAIYRFRGADLATYLLVRRAIEA